MKNLIAAVDFSKSTEAVLIQSAKLAKAFQAKLWILHVASDETQALSYEASQYTCYAPEVISMPGDVQLARNISAEEMKREHKELLGISSNLRNDGIETQALLLKGDATRLILEKAAELKAETIILGSHGHGLLHKALLGSVSESIINHARCNVLVVPSAEEHA